MGLDHTSTCKRKVWTGIYCFTWILILIGLVIWHAGIAKLAPKLKVLPDNLKKGFDDTLRFASMKSDSEKVQTQASAALVLCGTNVASCPSPIVGAGVTA